MSDFYMLCDEDQAERLAGLAAVALKQWDGEFTDIRLLKYRENAVFSAQGADGSKVAVRIHRHGYHSDDALRSELHWMQALADEGIDVPPIIRPRCGNLFVTVEAQGIPEARQVDMLGWLNGTPIGSAEDGLALDAEGMEALFFDIGALAATVHIKTRAMAMPDGFTRHSWDADGLVGEDPLWGRFWELDALTDPQRELLQRARHQAHRDLEAFGKSDTNFGLIHADFVPENLLAEEGRLKLIDFDDSGYGWRMFELATALYFNVDEPNYPALERAVFVGYRSRLDLCEREAALLPLFLFLRGTTYLGWIQTRPETQTARELGAMLIPRTCQFAKDYLDMTKG